VTITYEVTRRDFYLDNVMTVRDKDWDKIKDAFVIPQAPLELEKGEICLLHKKKKAVKYEIPGEIQSDLLSLFREKK